MRNGEFRKQLIKVTMPTVPIGVAHFQNGHNILLNRQPAENRSLLRKVADAHAGPAVHREFRNIGPIKDNMTSIRCDEVDNAIKASLFFQLRWGLENQRLHLC